MKMSIEDISREFLIMGDFVKATPFGTGHINDTYCATYSQGGNLVRYIHQRLNTDVFTKPHDVTDNIIRVTTHLYVKCYEREVQEPSRRVLQLVPTVDGYFALETESGEYWRTYLFVEGAATHDVIENEEQAFKAAAAFAQFQKDLSDLDSPRLHETIPDFHNTVARYEAFEKALSEAPQELIDNCSNEIAFVQSCKDMCGTIINLMNEGKIPERITHNDTKLNNILIDNETNEGVCIIDLDTVMPGSALYDFGDLVRTSATTAAEDEKDLTKVVFDNKLYEALEQGYLSVGNTFLNDTEKEYLLFSAKLITFEIGLRFLTDYLQKNIYFKVDYPEHNLIRSRTQFKLVEEITEYEKSRSSR